MSKAAKAYIGTSGFNYKHWAGLFYPKGLRQAEWLSHYARTFPTVELNVTFYRFPRAAGLEQWARQTPKGFLFAVKLWRGITHFKKLKNCRQFTANFLEILETLAPRQRAPLLIQLPPNMRRNVERLEGYLEEIRELAGRPWKLAVEFRSADWLCDEVYRALDRQRAAICLHDMKGSATHEPNGARFVYLRRHGPADARYHGAYPPEDIQEDARRIRRWTNQGRSVYAYFNNDLGGHAVENARQLMEALDRA
ncbi:MAG: DUF72 domain-containing protein [Bryobacteraceae bacterium]|nr:DUF72 domain-containing protein [Bryobacteraceae bacterium]